MTLLIRSIGIVFSFLLIIIASFLFIARQDDSELFWIIFASNRDGVRDIYRMNPDGSDVRRLSKSETDIWTPRWSADGEWLVYETTENKQRRP